MHEGTLAFALMHILVQLTGGIFSLGQSLFALPSAVSSMKLYYWEYGQSFFCDHWSGHLIDSDLTNSYWRIPFPFNSGAELC